MTIATATAFGGFKKMARDCDVAALSEPVVIPCLQLIDGDLTVSNGNLYFTGWEFVPGINGTPDEYRIAVRFSIPGSAAVILAMKALRALMPVLH
jgi:hypothetical protein